MFGQKRANYPKLKTNLRLVIQRLKLLEKKKTELALKSRKEIADYISAGKTDRARIRVEHIVREDYMVEAMELLEMFCDLLLARFGIIEKMKELDPSLEKPVATLIWAAPRLMSDVPEFNTISVNLINKYGKEFGESCRTNSLELVDEKVLHRMSVYAPPSHLIESYMVEIARTYNVDFDPDPNAFQEYNELTNTDLLIDFANSGDGSNKGGGAGNGGAGGGAGYGGAGGGGHFGVPAGAVDPSTMEKRIQVNPNPPLPSAPNDIPHLPTVPGNAQAPFSYPAPKPQGGPSQPGGFPQGSSFPQAPGGAVGGYPQMGGGYPQVNPFPPVPGSGGPPQNAMYNAGPPGHLPPQPPSYDATMSVPANQPVDMAGIIPDLPTVPESLPGGAGGNSAGGEDVDFDDLTRRFDELKRNK